MNLNSQDLNYSSCEIIFMLLQGLLILFVMLGWPRRMKRPASPQPLMSCVAIISLGGCLRLGAAFLLLSSGFNYLQNDDPCRLVMAWNWLQHPGMMTGEGIWHPGSFCLNGLVMKIVNDPLVATKIIAGLFCLAPLAAMFCFALGLFDDRRAACAAVLVMAPLWMHLLLSTGTMTEMPTITFLFAGAGFLLMALRREPSRRRLVLLAAAALAFNLATSFHTTAWGPVFIILVTLMIYALTPQGKANGFGPGAWFCFSFASGLYCAAWLIDCWRVYGDPLYTFHQNPLLFVRDNGLTPGWRALLVYPWSMVFILKSILPLVVFGVVWSWFTPGQSRPRRRIVLGVIGAAVLLMVGSAIHGRVSHQARAMIILATALVPFTIAPFFPKAGSDATQSQPFKPLHPAQKGLFWTVAALAGVLFLLTNFQNMMSHQRMTDLLHADNVALGTWLRQEMIRPQSLKPENLNEPVVFWHQETGLADFLQVASGMGFLNMIQSRLGTAPTDLKPHQIVVTKEAITNNPRLALISRIGAYYIYEEKS